MDIFALNSLLIVTHSVFRLSARVHAPAAPTLIRYFKLNTDCQDGPLISEIYRYVYRFV